MSPFPGTRVIPAGWSKHHQPVATGGMNAAVVITDPARLTPGAFDPTTGTYGPSTEHVILPVPGGLDEDGHLARIQAVTYESDTEQAGQESTARRYLVQLDDAALTAVPVIEVGYVVRVVSAANDSRMVGLEFTVTDVQHGSERFTRDLICEHNQQPA